MSNQETEYRNFTTDEWKWINRFRRVMNDAPDTLFLFNGSGSLIVYVKDENNDRYITSLGGVDDDAPCAEIPTNIETDGGDW